MFSELITSTTAVDVSIRPSVNEVAHELSFLDDYNDVDKNLVRGTQRLVGKMRCSLLCSILSIKWVMTKIHSEFKQKRLERSDHGMRLHLWRH